MFWLSSVTRNLRWNWELNCCHRDLHIYIFLQNIKPRYLPAVFCNLTRLDVTVNCEFWNTLLILLEKSDNLEHLICTKVCSVIIFFKSWSIHNSLNLYMDSTCSFWTIYTNTSFLVQKGEMQTSLPFQCNHYLVISYLCAYIIHHTHRLWTGT